MPPLPPQKIFWKGLLYTQISLEVEAEFFNILVIATDDNIPPNINA